MIVTQPLRFQIFSLHHFFSVFYTRIVFFIKKYQIHFCIINKICLSRYKLVRFYRVRDFLVIKVMFTNNQCASEEIPIFYFQIVEPFRHEQLPQYGGFSLYLWFHLIRQT